MSYYTKEHQILSNLLSLQRVAAASVAPQQVAEPLAAAAVLSESCLQLLQETCWPLLSKLSRSVAALQTKLSHVPESPSISHFTLLSGAATLTPMKEEAPSSPATASASSFDLEALTTLMYTINHVKFQAWRVYHSRLFTHSYNSDLHLKE
jgi:hypothetical protein